MTSEKTQEMIRSAFIELLEKEDLEKISVKRLCEHCGINRNTFYYHFSDIYDVLDGVLRAETEKIAAESVTSIEEEYRRRADMLYSYKDMILHVYRKSPGILYKYLDTVTGNIVSKYVSAASGGRLERCEKICEMYEYTVKGALLDWLAGGMPAPDEKSGETFASFFETTLPALLASSE